MRVAVTGANGQLGTDLCHVLAEAGHDVVPLTHADVEIADAEQTATVLENAAPEAVINTAAMHNVEACEADPDSSFRVNALGTRNLAFASRRHGARFIHISTDYVFDGRKSSPWVETDCPRPLNVYAASKVAGESFALCEGHRPCVVRVSGLFGLAPCRAKGGRNFVTLMLGLARDRDEVRVVDNEILSPTYTVDAAWQLLRLLESQCEGIFHVAGSGQCSWHAFARRIFDLAGSPVRLSVARPDEFPAKVRRPLYTALDGAAARQLGLPEMPRWEDALERYMSALQQAGNVR